VSTAPTPLGGVAQDDTQVRKLLKLEDNRPLSPAELYRALNDALDEEYELFDLSNREARFALILTGTLNAALLIAATQSGLAAQLSPSERQIEGAVIGIYAIFALGFLLQAIAALRPGQYRPHLEHWPRERNDYPKGVRYFEDVAQRGTTEHWDAWRRVTLRELNAELAVMVHSLALKNIARKKALWRLYNSLRIMTVTIGAILALFVVFTLT
jgi:hypothetical protein